MAVSISLSIVQNSQNQTNLTSNVTVNLTASWTGGSFNRNDPSGWVTIDGTKYTFSSDFNSSQTNSGSQTIFTKTLNISHNATTGYKTLECSASFATGVSSGTVTASKSKELTQLPTITVSYNANGGTGAPSSQSKYYGKALTLSSTKPTKSGYTFVGWGTSSNDGSSNYSPGGSYTENSNITLYAIWKKEITLSYGANGGTGAPSSYTATIYNAEHSYKFTLSSTTPTRTGYTFLGWSKSSTATSSSYSPGDTIILSESDTLYAVWKVNTFTVNYYSNYADYCELDVAVSTSTNVKVHSQVFNYSTAYDNGLSDYTSEGGAVHMTRTGHTGTGIWNTSADGTGTSVDESTSFESGQKVAEAFGKSIKTGDASVNVYAQWQINTYTVSYNANGGSGAPSKQTKTYGQTLTLSTTKPTRTNYTFQGWGTSSSDTTVDYNAGGSYTANANITLYAIWKLNTYTISYNLNGGVGTVESQTKTHGVGITLRNDVPTRSNYKFLGWSVSSNDTKPTYKPGDTFTSNANTVLYAIWERLGIAHINVNGTWKKGRVYINVNGTWKTGLIFKNVNGTWKQGGA